VITLKILLVGGTWTAEPDQDGVFGKPSKMVATCIEILSEKHKVSAFNGGNYYYLHHILETAKHYDVVFWWANVDNELEKVRDVKAYAPHVMFVNSKRNDHADEGKKYSFMELTQMTLAAKANLTFEFSRNEDGHFDFMVFDPLGCAWYQGNALSGALEAAVARLEYLRQITRQRTICAPESRELALAWYFDRFKQTEYHSEREITVPDEDGFISLVRQYAEKFHEIMKPANEVKRFLGNASMRPMPPQVGRCSKGMPSFRAGGYVFVSQRNVDKQFLDMSHFVPTYLERGKVYYCGEHKPSVDTPIQLRLYEELPNINYIIHSHCYIAGAPFTTKSIPCGAIEEVDEVMDALRKHYGEVENKRYVLNLIGHGSLAFGQSVSDLEGLNYYGRPLPEVVMEVKE
jgi:ribulose-5-phosphate 4-epimerase/fuculose-1-phosphate aldolase